MNRENPLWVEKYRPSTLKDTILPERIKSTLNEFVSKGFIPNITLCGPPGTGKTTAAIACIKDLGADYIVINGSKDGNIDTLRNDIQRFASSTSIDGSRKYVILDEADYLNPQSTQPALRNFMESFSKNCGFILTCNNSNKMHEALLSRAPILDFRFRKAEYPEIAKPFLNRVYEILESENVQYEKHSVSEIIKRFWPDFRKIINEIQKNSSSGTLDAGKVLFSDEDFKLLVSILKEKNFSEVRKWVAENTDFGVDFLFREFYDKIAKHVVPSSLPELILILAKYQYQAAFVADQEINLSAFFVEVMINAEWK